MAVVSKLLGFPSLTLAAVIESFVAIKVFPDYYDSKSHLAAVFTILLVNYAFGIVFWGFLYPVFFSPLRHIPGPRVRSSLSSVCSRTQSHMNISTGIFERRSSIYRCQGQTIRRPLRRYCESISR